ncbi:IS66 family insertion sequence element accessory protein TnpB [Sphingobium sp. BS19]|uniref:IS66 family insertion sequence element accessory protein TnpB n=1 Tax=Sphingobium sp. BS19 TaxID=3018973 RepID=UPI002491EE4C|nr:IS66 family insertion sequence element accessory protein TnpB [Sphingobium sp. BS19]
MIEIEIGEHVKILVASTPIDFRRGINGLVALVAQALKMDPYCGSIFVFRSKRRDRLKLIAWDGSGMILVTKWLEAGSFAWPPARDGVVHLTGPQMAMLLAGHEWTTALGPAIKDRQKRGKSANLLGF